MNRNDLFGYYFQRHILSKRDRNCSLFLNRYFQSRPEIFANQSDGSSQAIPAVSAAMNRASDVTSKMVMGGLRNANNASRPGNANTTVSTVSLSFGCGGKRDERTRTIIFFVADFCCCS